MPVPRIFHETNDASSLCTISVAQALYKSSLQEAARACAMQDSRPEVQKKSAVSSSARANMKTKSLRKTPSFLARKMLSGLN